MCEDMWVACEIVVYRQLIGTCSTSILICICNVIISVLDTIFYIYVMTRYIYMCKDIWVAGEIAAYDIIVSMLPLLVWF
jgi:hypothetical protein